MGLKRFGQVSAAPSGLGLLRRFDAMMEQEATKAHS